MLLVVSAGCWGDCVEIVFLLRGRGRGRGRQLNWSYIELARLARVSFIARVSRGAF